ncbi:uncharacterized protein BBA_02164 [Beauveria bassiana ARSEF 2860]|uniref:Uncharacterized protein n=1 Tax=Beauveria bassiana (strain ARSEF 2860) TaxID=655819 RepID=J4KQF8_BEAB2|nr:uncharacterized protein BBA_02164 [Beauveria bassiana ARSEF 2860]EJP69129.1 hypothetical protein BBA_02164 [Beauveria bassiana ARSEF 2860]
MASHEVEVEWQSLMALDLPPAPANIRLSHYRDKAQFMEGLATRYNEYADSEETQFGCFQLAIFAIASPATIDAVQNDDKKLLEVGDSAKDLVKFFINGYDLKVAETVNESKQPSDQGNTPAVVESAAVKPTATANPAETTLSSLFARTFGSVRRFVPYHFASSRTPPEQPTTSSEPAPDPEPSTGGLKSLKRKRSHSDSSSSTLSDTVSVSSTVSNTIHPVANMPKTVPPRRSPPTACGRGVVNLVEATQLRFMLDVREEFSANKARYSIFDADTGARIADGTEYFVEMCTLDYAKKMYDCLGLSWVVRSILFMAGGAGTPDAKPKSDFEYWDPDFDIADPDEARIDQKRYEEYLLRQFGTKNPRLQDVSGDLDATERVRDQLPSHMS